MSWRICFLLAIALAKKVNEFHGSFYNISGMNLHLCLEFVAEILKPLVLDLRFEEFTVPSLHGISDGD